MSERFKFGIVVDVVPLDCVGKDWEYFEVPASIHCSPILNDREWEAQKALYKKDGRPCMTSSHLLGPGLTYIGGSGENYDKELIQFSFRAGI